ncbi:MAG: hypothetical protein ACLGGX_10105 [Bdellovibrionia bacterium]
MKHGSFKRFILIISSAFFLNFLLACSPQLETKSLSSTPTPISEGNEGQTETTPREPASVDTTPPHLFDHFYDVGKIMGAEVDEVYRSNRELLPQRSESAAHFTDYCDPQLQGKNSFAERISHAVEIKMRPSVAGLGYVGSLFGMGSDEAKYLPNSLISHPLCKVTSQTLNETLAGKNIPNANTIAKINRFADEMNFYRESAIKGEIEGYKKASQLWGKFFMCLSYMESLTTADVSRSFSVADKYAPRGYRKPAGVKFYEDPNQSQASKLNIGIYQFTPDAGGNVQSCIREWNQVYPQCAVKRNEGTAELIRIFGSSLQTFNTFCAAAKTTGMFSVQINSASAKNTHPNNVRSDGRLKPAQERCVSPHMSVGKSYNHFGPFQNSSGFTLETVMNCVYSK